MRKPKLIGILLQMAHLYRVRDYQPDVSDYGFAFIRWMLNTIAILIVGAAIFVGLVISSMVIH
ncbi:MAG: hypothetical protein WB499_09765 [Pseudolabrys sp.]